MKGKTRRYATPAEARTAQLVAMKAWRERNKERIRDYARAWHRENKDRSKAHAKATKQRRIERGLCAWCAQPRVNARHCAVHKEKNRLYTLRWYHANKESRSRQRLLIRADSSSAS